VPNNLPIDGHGFRRLEVLTGTPRRRHWSNAQKAAIVAESLTPGVRASEIALRHGLHRNQLYEWRRQFRSGAVAAAGVVASDFVPVVAEDQSGSGTTIAFAGLVEREFGGLPRRLIFEGPGGCPTAPYGALQPVDDDAYGRRCPRPCENALPSRRQAI
jgi:transposase